MGRGGAQAPDNKPRVSGPGAFSRRTDMDGSQPIRAPGGQDYGERTALEQQQASAPVPEGGAMGEGATSDVGASTADPVGLLSSLGTQNPMQDVTAGAQSGQGSAPMASRDLVEGVEYLIQTLEAPSQELVDFYMSLRAQQVQ